MQLLTRTFVHLPVGCLRLVVPLFELFELVLVEEEKGAEAGYQHVFWGEVKHINLA